ncbi:hypothetical protein [Haloarchaeobius salinus]|uniref:hypothetical protein n=1 Tax=Haloarchaeobius salinus TaxID=1198298 RepID=UPI00210E92E7|nr:hypothetical protein [Haloarchaeobius salinus]
MRRRTVLAGGSVALTSLLGGCSAVSTVVDDSPSLPPGMSVRAEHVGHDVFESRERAQPGYKEMAHRVFTERDDAMASIASGELPPNFLGDTDFEASFLVVVQYGRQSATWLDLDRIERTDGGLHVVARVEEPSGGYGDDLAIHSLLLRITDSRDGVPDRISVTVDDR